MASRAAKRNARRTARRAARRAGSTVSSASDLNASAPEFRMPDGIDAIDLALLESDGDVYWYDEQTGRKYLDYAYDRWRGHLVVLFNNGHVWDERTGTYRPMVFDGTRNVRISDYDIPECWTLGDACRTHHAFAIRGM